MGFLSGKRVLIVGLASKRSIAYGIAASMHREGAEIALTYQNEKLKPRIEEMAAEWNSEIVLECDVSKDEDIEGVAATLKQHWGHLDTLVHSVAYAPQEQLAGSYHECVSREGFQIAHDISSFSLAGLAKACAPLMAGRNASIMAMTYIGATRAVTNYNVMGVAKASLEANIRYLAASLGPQGIRVNGISAGPIRTLAAAGIKNFKTMLNHNEKVTPLRQNVTIEQVGDTAAFLASNMSSGITGEIIHVDAGFHITPATAVMDE